MRLSTGHAGDWIVHKVGGTAIGKFPEKVVDAIVCSELNGDLPVVVCSARSSRTKVLGTTGKLLEVYKTLQYVSVATGNINRWNFMFDRMCKIIRSIRDEHLSAVHSLVKSAEIRRQTSRQIEDDCQGLLDYICIFRFNPFDINSRSKDSLLSVGEILSCRLITAMLLDRNVDAVFVSLCGAVPAGSTHRLEPGWFEEAAEAFGKRLQPHHGKVIVVTGFFGVVPGSLIDSSIGRGYSDVCAALVGIGLQAKRINIWKEVDGIFTADPREVADARCLSTITSSEVAALTFYGSEVVHHLALTLATKACPPIEMSVRNIQKPSAQGTLIIPNPAKPVSKQMITHFGSGENGGSLAVQAAALKAHTLPTGITVKRDTTVIGITSNGNSLSCDFFANVFAILASHNVAADLVCITESQISMAINTVAMSAERMEDFQLDLEREGSVSIGPNRAILSLVGPTSKATTAIAGQMFSVLGKQSIAVEMISQGRDQMNLSCVVPVTAASTAMKILHNSFFSLQ